jgi:hypothetical protein
MKRLEPGEATDYTISWDFSAHPLLARSASEKREDMIIVVETTKKTLSQKAHLDWVTISGPISIR